MSLVSAVVLGCVFLIATSVVTFAFRERSLLSKELAEVVEGIHKRTQPDGETRRAVGGETDAELEEILDEAIQVEDHQRAVFAIGELSGRAGLRRTRARLFARALPRIALLTGAGGAFVVVALGNFDHASLALGMASVSLGLVASFSSVALNGSSLRLAKKYAGIVDVLARQVEGHFSAG